MRWTRAGLLYGKTRNKKGDHRALRRIASECGFATLKHLQRMFKARFGQSTTSYRSSHST